MRLLNLRWRLLVFVVVPLATMNGVLGVCAILAFERATRARMEVDVQIMARALQAPIMRIIDDGDVSLAALPLEEAFVRNGNYAVFLYDARGDMLARAGSARDFEPVSLDGAAWRNASRLSSEGNYSEAAGESFYSYFIPLATEGGKVHGILQVARLKEEFERFVNRLWIWGGTILGVSTFFVIGVIAVGYREGAGKSIHALQNAMESVRGGNRKHEPLSSGPLEIVELSQTFSRMLRAIREAESEIEARRRAERELHNRLLESKKLAAIGKVAGAVAHELGTPLTVVDGSAQRALRRADNPSTTAEALADIREGAGRMDQIIRQLLSFGRGDGNKRSTVATDELASAAARAVEGVRRRQNCELLVREPVPVTISVDRLRAELALANLLKNAFEAAPGQTIDLSWEATDDYVTFSVFDSGPGMDEADAKRIFEPFYSTKQADGGTGLGLAIVAQVADEHGGGVEIQSRRGEGSCFRLSFKRRMPGTRKE